MVTFNINFKFKNLFGCLLLLGTCAVQAPVAETQTDANPRPAQADTDADLEATLGYRPIQITVTQGFAHRTCDVSGEMSVQAFVNQIAAILWRDVTAEFFLAGSYSGLYVLVTSEERKKLELDGRNRVQVGVPGLGCEYKSVQSASVANFSDGPASVQFGSGHIPNLKNVYVWTIPQAMSRLAISDRNNPIASNLRQMLKDCSDAILVRELFSACKSSVERAKYFEYFDAHQDAQGAGYKIFPLLECEQQMFDAFVTNYCEPSMRRHSFDEQAECTELLAYPEPWLAKLCRLKTIDLTINDMTVKLSYLALGITQDLVYVFLKEYDYFALRDQLTAAGARIEATGIVGFSEIANSNVHIISPQCLMFMRPESLDAIFDASVVMVNRGDTADFTDFHEAHKSQRNNFAQQKD